jgi:hypothetical protein
MTVSVVWMAMSERKTLIFGGLEAYMQLHGKPAPTPVADMIRYGQSLYEWSRI